MFRWLYSGFPEFLDIVFCRHDLNVEIARLKYDLNEANRRREFADGHAESWRNQYVAKANEVSSLIKKNEQLNKEIRNACTDAAMWNREYAEVKVKLEGITSIINDGFYGNKVLSNAPVPVTPLPQPPWADSVAAVFTEALKDVPDTGTVEDYLNLVGGPCKSMFAKQEEQESIIFDRAGAIEQLVRRGFKASNLQSQTDNMLRSLLTAKPGDPLPDQGYGLGGLEE